MHSAKVRLEQQQIHVQELSRHSSERFNATHRLKLVQAALEKLLAFKAQWHGKTGQGQ
jgi:hypothetical protein